MRPEVRGYADAAALERHAAADLHELLRAAIARAREREGSARHGPGRATLVLAGGRTPRGVYQRLGAMPDLDWSRVELLFGDERAVPPADPASNFGMVQEALLARLEARDPDTGTPVVHRVEGELGAEEAARRYARVVDAVEAAGPIDIALLGMGEDGHVASIFPDTREPPHTPVIVSRSPLPPPARVSLTLATLARARVVMMLVAGAAKAERLGEVWHQIADGSAALPAARLAALVPADGRLIWQVDEAAAARLPGGWV